MTTTDTLDIPLAPPPGGQVLHTSGLATVIWGDCRDPAVLASVPDGYGLLCTDPPYGVGWQSNYGRNHGRIAGDDGTVDWPQVLRPWVGTTGTKTDKLAEHRHVYVFGYRPEDVAGPLRLGGKPAELVWDKMITGMGDMTSPWGVSHERIVFGVHVKSNVNRADGRGSLPARLRQGSVLRYPRPNSQGARRHPTEKPVPLMADLVVSSTVRGDLVVDPCAGSGSTGVAAILEGRRCFLVEYDHGYATLAAQRVKAAEKIATQIAKC